MSQPDAFFMQCFSLLLEGQVHKDKKLAPPPFKKEGRDYAFYMRDYKGETAKLLPFYMTDFLFTEL